MKANKTWQEIIDEANQIESTRKAQEKVGCRVAGKKSKINYPCDCKRCWHNEFDNCQCGACPKHR